MRKKILLNNELIEIDVHHLSSTGVQFVFEGKEYSFEGFKTSSHEWTVKNDSANKSLLYKEGDGVLNGKSFSIFNLKNERSKNKSTANSGMLSPMPGKILKILVESGQNVEADTPLLVMEAMKMEHTIKSSKAGLVKNILFKEGDLIGGGIELINFIPTKEIS